MAECTCTWQTEGYMIRNPDCPVHGTEATYPIVDPDDDIGPPAPEDGWRPEFSNPEIGMKC